MARYTHICLYDFAHGRIVSCEVRVGEDAPFMEYLLRVYHELGKLGKVTRRSSLKMTRRVHVNRGQGGEEGRGSQREARATFPRNIFWHRMAHLVSNHRLWNQAHLDSDPVLAVS